jgi:hypothetical protein
MVCSFSDMWLALERLQAVANIKYGGQAGKVPGSLGGRSLEINANRECRALF